MEHVSCEPNDVFHGRLPEHNADYEQFFWTRSTVERLIRAMEHVPERCCLTTPSLAHAWYELGEHEICLDIDRRFAYMPRYRYFDVRVPSPLPATDTFRILILDPPFYVVPIEAFRTAVDVLTHNDFSTKLLLGFLRREEKRLLTAFAPYHLRPTKFPLEYASIKPSKWGNFCLYSNVDLPGIKRL